METRKILKFLDFYNDEELLENDFIKVQSRENLIFIEGQNNEDIFQIVLDIPTAIKFAKTFRTEINKAKEVDNE